MNKHKSQGILYVSILPIVVIIGLILGAGYFLLGDELSLPKFGGEPKLRRLEGFPTMLNVQDDRDKIRKVIKSEQELNEFLNTVDTAGLLTLNENINFDNEYLVAVSTKTLDEEGHEFKVRKIYRDNSGQEMLVSLLREDPGGTCTPEGDKNIWIDLVAVDKTDWSFDFELVKKIVECE